MANLSAFADFHARYGAAGIPVDVWVERYVEAQDWPEARASIPVEMSSSGVDAYKAYKLEREMQTDERLPDGGWAAARNAHRKRQRLAPIEEKVEKEKDDTATVEKEKVDEDKDKGKDPGNDAGGAPQGYTEQELFDMIE